MNQAPNRLSRTRFLRLTTGVLATGGVSVLSACAIGGSASPGGGTSAAPKKVAGVVEVMSWGNEFDLSQVHWQPRIQALNARYPELKVENVQANFGNGGQEYDQKLIALAAAGTSPDVTLTDGTRLSNFYPRSILAELDSYMARVKFDKGNYTKASWVANERKGKVIALPYRAQPYPFFVNRALYTRAGLKAPSTTWTLDNFLEQGRRLTAPDGSQWGIDQMATTVSRYSMFIWAFGGDFFDKGYTKCTLDGEPAIQGMQYIADLVTKHRVHVPPGTRGVAFGSGNVAIQSTGAGRLPTNWEFDWGLATMPKGPKAADVCLISNDWAMLKTGKNPEGAWGFLEWMSSDEGQKLLAEEGALPTNLRMAKQHAFGSADAESRQAILRVLETGRNLPYDAPLWGEVRPLWEDELPKLWKGEVTAKDLMQRVVPLVNDKLKQAPR